MQVLVNAMANNVAGGFTVARRMTEYLARARPDWGIHVLVSAGLDTHELLARECTGNRRCIRAPAATANRWHRLRFERQHMRRLVRESGASVVVQFNGMVVPGLGVPTLSHCGDPWPYLPVAQTERFDRLHAWMKRQAYRQGLAAADSYGFTSGYLRDLMLSHHRTHPPRTAVYYNGVPETWIDGAAETDGNSDSRPLELLTVGNVCPYKGQHKIVEALALLVGRPGLSTLKLRIVGTCHEPFRSRILAQIARLGVGENVVLTGLIPDSELRAAYERSRCFVFASVCESFGIPPLEAMSCGTPVVAARAAAVPEICGDAASYFEPDDIHAMADAIEVVLSDRDRASALANAGAKRVRKFSWRTSAEALATELATLTQ